MRMTSVRILALFTYLFIFIVVLSGMHSMAGAAESLYENENLYEQIHKKNERSQHKLDQILKKEFETKVEASQAYRRLLRDVYDCATVIDRILRLRCFDELSVDRGINTADWQKREDKKLGEFAFWDISLNTNDIGEQVFYAKLKPNNELTGRENSPLKPEIVLKCTLNNFEIYLDWKRALTGYSSQNEFYIVYDVDRLKKYPDDWTLSLDKKAAFVPDPIKFVETLQGGRNLYFTFTAGSDGVQRLLFSLDGLERVMAMVLDHCY